MVSYFNFLDPVDERPRGDRGGWRFTCRSGAQKRALNNYGCGENGAAFIICVDCFKISPLVIG
jgi:hypothetical protein